MKYRKGTIQKEKKMKSIFLLNILFLLFLIIFLFCGVKLYYWQNENAKSKRLTDEVRDVVEIEEEKGDYVKYVNPPEEGKIDSSYISDYYYYMNIPFLSVNFEKLIEKNADTVGWINVNGTDINYPIVKSQDNAYYLTHSFDKSYNSSGWIFADYRCSLENLRENTIIYGHNRHNNTLFGTLLNTMEKKWCDNKDNRIIRLSTIKQDTMWQIFSVYTTIDKNADYLDVYFASKEEHQNYLDKMKNRSIYNFNTPVTTEDKILTLSTCTMDTKNRVVVQAKLLKITDK